MMETRHPLSSLSGPSAGPMTGDQTATPRLSAVHQSAARSDRGRGAAVHRLHVRNVCSGCVREIYTGRNVCSAKCVHVCSRHFVMVNLPGAAFGIRRIAVLPGFAIPLNLRNVIIRYNTRAQAAHVYAHIFSSYNALPPENEKFAIYCYNHCVFDFVLQPLCVTLLNLNTYLRTDMILSLQNTLEWK